MSDVISKLTRHFKINKDRECKELRRLREQNKKLVAELAIYKPAEPIMRPKFLDEISPVIEESGINEPERKAS